MEDRLSMLIAPKIKVNQIVLEMKEAKVCLQKLKDEAGNMSPSLLEAYCEIEMMTEIPPVDIALMRGAYRVC